MKTLALGLAGAVLGVSSLVAVGGDAHAAPPGDDSTIAFVVRGVGNGHGRGLSQWGAYGRAISGQSWQTIVGAYYGGTSGHTVAAGRQISVRLNAFADVGTVGAFSPLDQARWRPDGGVWSPTSTSISVEAVGGGLFQVRTATTRTCVSTVPSGPLSIGADGEAVSRIQRFLRDLTSHNPGLVDGDFGPMTKAAVQAFQTTEGLPADGVWAIEEATAARELIDPLWSEPVIVTGPIDLSVAGSPSAPGDQLALCGPRSGVTHYRGTARVHDTHVGIRTANVVAVEDYLRGVVPKEVPAGWGDDAGGKGARALEAQSVAARSYGIAQNRGYWIDAAQTQRYATTCDSPSCQVYGGAATRATSLSNIVKPVEHAFTDAAIAATARQVRVWAGTTNIVSTEFSASNGPYTAGGSFPSVADPYDDQPGNPNHRWTRVIDADAIMSKYGLAHADGVATRVDADSPYAGVWANEVVLGNGAVVSAWDFRNAFGLPTPGFELVPVRRTVSEAADFAFIGDSVGASVAGNVTAPLRILTEGVFDAARWDAVSGRRTQGGSGIDGVEAAELVPIGTDLVVVELGYNDDPAALAGRIAAVMGVLRARGVGAVAWVNLSERRPEFAVSNDALAAAAAEWSELLVLDWHGASSHKAADRWFEDGVHLTTSGRAEFSLWLRDHVVDLVADGYTPPRPLAAGVPMRIPVTGEAGLPSSGVAGVALNVTAVGPVGPGWLRVWPCGVAQPTTATVNYLSGDVAPNAAVVPVDGTGEVCIVSKVATDVVVDLAGWFDSGLRSGVGRLYDSRDANDRLSPGETLEVPVRDRFGVPSAGVAGVALNVTAVDPGAAGWIRAWPCGLAEPTTASVNYLAGEIVGNAALVPVGAAGSVCLASKADTDVVVDLAGWFDGGLATAVGRLHDSRVAKDRLSPGEVLRVPVLDRFGVPAGAAGVAGVALNVTAVGPAAGGWLRVWSCGVAEPATATVNYLAGEIAPNAAVVPVDGTGEVCIVSKADTDVVVDLAGWFESGLRHVTPERLVDTRYGPMPR